MWKVIKGKYILTCSLNIFNFKTGNEQWSKKNKHKLNNKTIN